MLGIYCRTSKSRDEKYTLDNQREDGTQAVRVVERTVFEMFETF